MFARIAFLSAALAASPAAPLAAAEALQTSIPHAILIDAETGSVLFEKGADDPVAPASTTKIMTADIVFEALASGKIKLTDEFPVSESAWREGGAPSHGSAMFAKLNSRVDVEDLIRGMVVVSGNDAALVLADGIAGSEGAMAAQMTARAHDLGFKHLTFTNVWGRDDPEQRVTARDMAGLAAHVIATYPAYYKYFSERDFTWNKIKQPNRNPLLTADLGADGLKTGYIDKASGYSLVGSAVENGQRLIVALYGASSAKERLEEARKILQWGFRSFETKQLFAAGETVGSAKVYGGTSESVDLVADKAVRLLVPREAGERLTGRIVYNGPLLAPVQADKPVGHLKISRGTLEILDVPLKTAADVPVGSLPHRALDAGVEYVGDVLRHYISKR